MIGKQKKGPRAKMQSDLSRIFTPAHNELMSDGRCVPSGKLEYQPNGILR